MIEAWECFDLKSGRSAGIGVLMRSYRIILHAILLSCVWFEIMQIA